MRKLSHHNAHNEEGGREGDEAPNLLEAFDDDGHSEGEEKKEQNESISGHVPFDHFVTSES